MFHHAHFPAPFRRRNIKAFFALLNIFYIYSAIIDRKSHSARCAICNQLICEPKNIMIYSRFAPIIVLADILSGVIIYKLTNSMILGILVVYLCFNIPYAAILLFGNWMPAQTPQESEIECRKRLINERKETRNKMFLSVTFWAQLFLSIVALICAFLWLC